jgi:hypothetical protein
MPVSDPGMPDGAISHHRAPARPPTTTSPLTTRAYPTDAEHNASSVVRGMPYHSSKPWSFGNRPSWLPRCHLPCNAVAYPASDSDSAIVTSHGVNPSGTVVTPLLTSPRLQQQIDVEGGRTRPVEIGRAGVSGSGVYGELHRRR